MNIGPITLTNTVSGVVLGVLLILVGGFAWLANGVYKTRTEARAAKESSQHVEHNTRNVSNGFAGNVVGKLDHIVREVDKLQNAHADHLKWHLEREQNNG